MMRATEADVFDVLAAIRGARRSAHRLEQQPSYASDFYPGHFDRWRAGDPVAPADTPDYPEWLELVREVTGRGVDLARVRVDEVPATEVNLWARWKGAANAGAGETVLYVDRPMVDELDLGPDDWWLIDDEVLAVLSFDDRGEFRGLTVTTDPKAVEAVGEQWRTLREVGRP